MKCINKIMQIVIIPAIAIMALIISGCMMVPCQQFALAIMPGYTEVRVVKNGWGSSGKDVLLVRMTEDTPEGKRLIKKFRKIAAREVCFSLRNMLKEQNGQLDMSIISRVDLVFVDAQGDKYSHSLMTGDKIRILGDISTEHSYDLTSYFSEEDQAKIIPHLKKSMEPD